MKPIYNVKKLSIKDFAKVDVKEDKSIYVQFQRCAKLFEKNGLLIAEGASPITYEWNPSIEIVASLMKDTKKLASLIGIFIKNENDVKYAQNKSIDKDEEKDEDEDDWVEDCKDDKFWDEEFSKEDTEFDKNQLPIHIESVLVPILSGSIFGFIPNITDSEKTLSEHFMGYYLTKRFPISFHSLLSYAKLSTPLNINIKLGHRNFSLENEVLTSVTFVEKGIVLNFGDIGVTIETLSQIESLKYSATNPKVVKLFKAFYKTIKENDKIEDILPKALKTLKAVAKIFLVKL
jgi:hypothetical protein